ncbi:MAG: dockerin type I domain-containing protein, partial [bacterium]|nr:dockerin type I domain-containing protein [bacterium]
IEGEGVLSVPSVKVHQGVAEVDLKAISVGQIRIRATVEGLAPVFAEVTALPALALDLNPAVGDQEQRTLERLPAVGMEMAVDLVILSGGVDMNGFQAILEFDPEFLAFEGFRPADLMDGATPILSFPKAGQVEINVAILGGRVDRERGSLGQAVFRVVQTGDVETAIGFLSAQIGRVSGQERLRVQTEQARVVVGGRLVGIGDLNGDGSVNLGDLIVFARHFGTRQGESGFDARFDLDGNGEVGLDDFLIFVKGFGQAEGK